MTVEEKAKKYINNGWWKMNIGGWKDRMEEAFVAGYSEATRWRDPKKELPEDGIDVFVKVIRSGEYGEETIYTSSSVINDFYHSNDHNPFGCEGDYPAGYGGIVRVTVIGWRPIE